MASRLRILFVCGGNTCRSPMATGLAGKLFGARVHAESAGMDPEDTVSEEAVRVMAEEGIDISGHHPRDVADVAIDGFDYIIGMRPYIVRDLAEEFGVPKDKLITWDVKDPYRKGLEAYRCCAAVLRSHLAELGRTLHIFDR